MIIIGKTFEDKYCMNTLSNELQELIEKRESFPDEFTGTYWHPEKEHVDKVISTWVLQNSHAIVEALKIVENIYPNFKQQTTGECYD